MPGAARKLFDGARWAQLMPDLHLPSRVVGQLLLIVVPIFLVVQIAVTFALEARSAASYQRGVAQRLSTLADGRAPSLAESLWKLDYAKLGVFAAEYALDDRVTSVTFEDHTGAVVVRATGSTTDVTTNEIVRDLVYINGTIRAPAGRLIVTYACKPLFQRMLDEHGPGFLVSILAALALCVAIHLAAQSLIGRPLAAMMKAIQRSRAEGSHQHLELGGSNEFAELAAAFNEQQGVQAQSKALLEFLATHDDLTGLPTRRLLKERLERLATGAARDVALHFIDLDDFRGINDTFGHEAGDHYLVHVASQLRACVGKADWVARLGGDEFVVIQDHVEGEIGARSFAQTLLTAITVPLELRGKRIVPRGSIGIAVRRSDDPEVVQLPALAEIALYKTKKDRAGSISVVTPEMLALHTRRKEFARSVPQAFEREEFEVWFQGQFDVATSGLVGLEALVRWRHPVRGLVAPDDFIPLIEQSGKSKALARYVFERLCQARTVLEREGLTDVVMAMNVSPDELADATFALDMMRIAQAHKLPLTGFEIEITEGSLINRVAHTQEALARIRDLGVRVALDDFGKGYSSLSYLRRFPLDRLKIDKDFTREVPQSSGDLAILETIVALADKLQLEVVAEGVERPEQAETLRALGVTVAQGYHYHRPQPLPDLVQFIRRSKASTNGLRAAG